jgi:4-hydroxy-tetrahydrodipicolinate reductase
MGRAVADVAKAQRIDVVAVIGEAQNANGDGITKYSLAGADVAIEFTQPDAAAENVRACVRAGCPIVVGTTGWYAELDEVSADVLAAGGAMFYAANFSLGANVFWQVAEFAANLAARVGLDAHIVETHHAAKKDAPSGTAAELSKRASGPFGRTIPITSVRVGSVPGTHELIFDGTFEQLRIEHLARDRRVFAEGAVAAARWLIGKRGIFTMRDMLVTNDSSRST